MKKISYRLIILSVLSFFLFLCPLKAFAGSASLTFTGNGTTYVGREFSVDLNVTNISEANGGVSSVAANLFFDTNYLEYVSGTGVTSPYTFQINTGNNYQIAGLDTSMSHGIINNTKIFTFKFRAKQLGNTTISLRNVKLTDSNNKLNGTANAKTINITEPPSSNNNLKSLTVSAGSLSFDKSRTSYDVYVESNIDSITINAAAEDGGAFVSGTGTKGLNYGNNKFDITVKAPSGDIKTYKINVNRKDIRSSNNNLASLRVGDGQLSPSFNKNTLEYNISVPFAVSNLKIDAKAEDAKSRVSITNNNLISEETVRVRIDVTAENGSVKSYIIKATRGKDPDKPLSNNNYLASLNINNGILSPAFNKEQEKYIVYLPYEIDNIDINVTVEDERYAKVNRTGDSNLSEGANLFTFTVTAEDNSTRTYTVTVVRGINLSSSNLGSNVYLKSIKIKNGRLKNKFNKKNYFYTYTGGKITAIPEDANSKVKIIENKDATTIIVESQSGDLGVYTLKKEKVNKSSLFFGFMASLFIITSFVAGYKFARVRNIKK